MVVINNIDLLVAPHITVFCRIWTNNIDITASIVMG